MRNSIKRGICGCVLLGLMSIILGSVCFRLSSLDSLIASNLVETQQVRSRLNAIKIEIDELSKSSDTLSQEIDNLQIEKFRHYADISSKLDLLLTKQHENGSNNN